MTSSFSSSPPPHTRSTLPTLLDDEVGQQVVLPARKARNCGLLTRMAGPDAGQVFALGSGEVTIGRAEGCSIRIDDASLSRVHARLSMQDGAFVLEDNGSLNGCFVNDERVTRAVLRDSDRLQLGSMVSMRFQLVDEDEQQALVRIYESSVLDGLTGVFNRRHLDERLSAEVSYATRHGVSLALVMFDLDHFKQLNDSAGHLAGDAVLRATAGLIRASVRTEDVVARYGGEEFVVLARAVSIEGGVQLAERICAAIEKMRVTFEGREFGVTASAGVATLACCCPATDRLALLALADARLFRAKRTGRNRVVGAD